MNDSFAKVHRLKNKNLNFYQTASETFDLPRAKEEADAENYSKIFWLKCFWHVSESICRL